MKHLPKIVGALLGLAFITFSSAYFLGVAPKQEAPPIGSPPFLFMAACGPTGYMNLVKAFELLGGILLLIPKTRDWGLIIVAAILINIFAFHILLVGDPTGGGPLNLILAALTLYLLWADRRKFLALLHCDTPGADHAHSGKCNHSH